MRRLAVVDRQRRFELLRHLARLYRAKRRALCEGRTTECYVRGEWLHCRCAEPRDEEIAQVEDFLGLLRLASNHRSAS